MTGRLTLIIVAMFILMAVCFVIGEYFEHKKLDSYSSEQTEELLKTLTEELQNKMNSTVEPKA